MRVLFARSMICMILLFALPVKAVASDSEIATTFGGQIKLSFTGADYHNDSIHSKFKDNAWFSSDINLRIKSRTFFNDNFSFDCHYLFSTSIGDLMEASEFFQDRYSDTFSAQIFQKKFDNDDAKLLDLSTKIKEDNDYSIYHRIDRLNFSLDGDFGRVTMGRQAVTWGNGLLFNPMDIFNPFSPYDTERDYKKGDDMAYFEAFFEKGGNLQLLYVPRRDLQGGSVKFSQSSTAIKYNFFSHNMEFDFMAARHYEDTLAGMGLVGTLGNAAWRSDVIYTLAGGSMKENFLSVVMNIDYSWVWFKKNFYGFIEYYYSGLGVDDYSKVFTEHDLGIRISRGEIFGLGKNYLSSSIRIELNPLVNFNFTAIANLNDPSCLVRPGLTWNAAQNCEITIGANFAIGGKDDEYGQIQIPVSLKTMDYGSNLFLWVTLFF